jgi:hypothetical protein
MAWPQTSGRGETARTDAQLLDDGTSGLRILYERHFDALFRYVAGRVGRQAAEDVVAETFVIAFSRRAAFDPSYASAMVDRDRYELASLAAARREQAPRHRSRPDRSEGRARPRPRRHALAS